MKDAMLRLCRKIIECNKADCIKENIVIGNVESGFRVRPSPHIGGANIDTFCVFFVAQNPAWDKECKLIASKFDTTKYLEATANEDALNYHDRGLRESYMPKNHPSKIIGNGNSCNYRDKHRV